MSRILKGFGAIIVAFVLLITVSLGFVSSAHAEYLVRDAEITGVQNTSRDGDNFAVRVNGGSGPCNNRIIIFPKAGVTERDVYRRGYVMALEAMINNLRVDIFDYSGTSCENGGQLSVFK